MALHAPVVEAAVLPLATAGRTPFWSTRLSVTLTVTPVVSSPMFPLTEGEYSVSVTAGSGMVADAGALAAVAVVPEPSLALTTHTS